MRCVSKSYNYSEGISSVICIFLIILLASRYQAFMFVSIAIQQYFFLGSPLDMIPLFIFVFNIVKKVKSALAFQLKVERVTKRSINNEWNKNKRSTPKELRGKVRTLILCTECNIIYTQEYFLLKQKHQTMGKYTVFEKAYFWNSYFW